MSEGPALPPASADEPAANAVHLESVLALLRSERGEIVCGAALVLGELKPKDPRLVPALIEALEDADATTSAYLLDALAHQDDERSIPALLPYLTRPSALRDQAIRALARLGDAALPALEGLDAEAPLDTRQSVCRALARIGTPAAIDRLLARLGEADFELAKHATHALRKREPPLPPTSKEHLARSLCEKLATGWPDTATIAALKLLAHAGKPEHAEAITPYLSAQHVTVVRQNALECLAALPRRSQRADASEPPSFVPGALAILDEEHEPAGLRSAALRVVMVHARGALDDARLERVLAAEHAELARSAIRLAAERSPGLHFQTVLGRLHTPDTSVQSAAVQTLTEWPDLTEALLDAHADPAHAARASTLRTVLSRRPAASDADAFESLAGPRLRAVLADEALVSQVVGLGAWDPMRAAEHLASEAQAALDAQDPSRAIALLDPLVRHRMATPTGRYLLAIAHLARLPESAAEPSATPSEAAERAETCPHEADYLRARQLLRPLAKLDDSPLEAITREQRVRPSVLRRLAEEWAERPEPEASLGRALLSRSDAAAAEGDPDVEAPPAPH